jgi:hypothetical protein
VVGTDGVHDRVDAFERLAETAAVGDVDRLPGHACPVADGRCSCRVSVQDGERDRASCTGELVGDPATMEPAPEQDDPHQLDHSI